MVKCGYLFKVHGSQVCNCVMSNSEINVFDLGAFDDLKCYKILVVLLCLGIRPFPVFYGAGIGLGMAISNYQHDLNANSLSGSFRLVSVILYLSIY